MPAVVILPAAHGLQVTYVLDHPGSQAVRAAAAAAKLFGQPAPAPNRRGGRQ